MSISLCITPFQDEKSDDEDQEILSELENIDDECEQAGIPFVKMADAKEAKEYGIHELPSLVYFENRIPSIFEGKYKVNAIRFKSRLPSLVYVSIYFENFFL